jgi:iron complex outermembrane receptor protein
MASDLLHKASIGAGLIGVALTMISEPAHAESDSSTGIEAIVVTAERRSESVQDAPLAITALTGDQLRSAGVSNITQLSGAVPNLSIDIAAGVPHITMRGLGSTATLNNAEPDAAFSVDGFLIGRPEATVDSLFDIDRIEVVLGPQGTLYGRNTTGGAINVLTRDPTRSLDGYAQVTAGNFHTLNFEGAIGGPITDSVSGRIAVQSLNHGGYGTEGNGSPINNLYTNAVRLKVKYEATDNLSLVFSVSAFKEDDATSTNQFQRPGDYAPVAALGLGGVFAEDVTYNTNSDYPSLLTKADNSAGATLNWTISDHATLTALTGYRTLRYYSQDDYDSTQLDLTYIRTDMTDKQFTQEIRLGGTFDRFRYVIGAYYLHDRLDFENRLPVNALLVGGSDQLLQGYHGVGSLYTNARAAFGQASYEITDWLGIDVGGRYSQESKVAIDDGIAFDLVTPYNPLLASKWLAFIPRNDLSDSAFTPKGTLRAKVGNNILLYATYAKGFNSGGFNIGAASPAYQPEFLKDFELGIKTNWFAHRLQVDLSAFAYDYTNLQTQVQVSGNTGALATVNAGKAKLYGGEISIIATPTAQLGMDLNIGLLHSKYVEFASVDATNPNGALQNLEGYRLPNAPSYTISTGLQYAIESAIGTFTPRAEAKFVDRVFFTAFNTPAESQESYSRLRGELNYRSNSGLWSGGLYVDNLTGNRVLASITPTTILLGGYAEGVPLPPRTYGVRIFRSFGDRH